MSKIIGKRVSMQELFYDLIYVVAVAKITGLIHHLHHGVVDWWNILAFAMVTLILLLMWFDETIYINKHADWSWYDYIGIGMHMLGALYLTNNINLEWELTFVQFNVGALIMTVAVLFQYICRYYLGKDTSSTVKAMIRFNIIECIVLLVGLYIGINVNFMYGLTTVLVMYAVALMSPFWMRKQFTEVMPNFPHLVERVSLITIIVFGEMVTQMAIEFISGNVVHFMEVLIFATALMLFSIYRNVIERIMDHHQERVGQILIYSHMLLIIGLSMITVSYSFIHDAELNINFFIWFRGIGLFLFFMIISILSTAYGKEQYRLSNLETVAFFLIFFISSYVGTLATSNNHDMLNISMFIIVAYSYAWQQIRLRRIDSKTGL